MNEDSEEIQKLNSLDEEDEWLIEEDIREPWDPNDSKIDTKIITIDLLIKRIQENEVDLSPAFQRDLVWDKVRQSRLIESLLIKIPIPNFYFDATNDEEWVVVDGLQRLNTFKNYFIESSKFHGMQYLSQFNGLTYADLPRHLRRRIEETQVVVNLIMPGTPPLVKFDIFRRINTGGVPLSSQEIRNALNQGPVTKLLNTLANNEDFIIAISNSVSKERMARQEYVLRFLAFSITSLQDYRIPDIDAFLSVKMQELNGLENMYDELTKDFIKAMRAAKEIFGNRAFRKQYSPDDNRKPVNKSLFEAWSVTLGRRSNEEIAFLVERRDILIDISINMLNNNRTFEKSISYATQDVGKTRTRFEVIDYIVKEILHDNIS